ncbi:MAG: phage virion morphogenesis protein [Syntrophobacteraceae bacterium]|nr:phage virion morphogenesis protein [Syntrophobacteraceae bacterium]
MTTLSIALDERRTKFILLRLLKTMSDLTAAMRQVGEVARERTMQSFERSRSPSGTPWTPSRRALRTGGKTLVRNAVLRNSIHVRASSDRVEVGSPLEYASIHQFGSSGNVFCALGKSVSSRILGPDRRRKSKSASCPGTQETHSRAIPARPFLGLNQSDWGEIRDVLTDFLCGGI